MQPLSRSRRTVEQRIFTRIALEEAPVALGWVRRKASQEKHFRCCPRHNGRGRTDRHPPWRGLAARMLLAALDEAGLSVASSPDPQPERARARDLINRLPIGPRDPEGMTGRHDTVGHVATLSFTARPSWPLV